MSKPRPIALLTCAIVAFSVAATTGDAAAQHRMHTVKAGDTLQLLAAEYYGERQHAVFIMVANNMEHARPLKVGERIRIPVADDVTAAAGDTFESLAEEHLGDERRGAFLARFNDVEPSASIAAGQRIRFPLRVTHKAAAKVSLGQLAANYLGSSKRAAILKSYNFLDTDTLEVGQSIIVPLTRVRMRRDRMRPPDAESKARIAKRLEMQKLARKALPEARAWWRTGDYKAIKDALVTIETDYLDSDFAVEIGLLLGSSYIAFGDEASAAATFKKTLEREPNHILSPVEYSPKILGVWTAAGGVVEEPAK